MCEELLDDWLSSSRPRQRVVRVTGPHGSGKSDWLRGAAQRTEGAFVVDCAGETAEAVHAEVRRRLSEQAADEQVAFLTNTQWSGVGWSSGEPKRFCAQLVYRLRQELGDTLRLVLESAASDPRPSPASSGVLTVDLTPAEGNEPNSAQQDAMRPVESALDALAYSEEYATAPDVWALLLRAVHGESVAAEELVRVGEGSARLGRVSVHSVGVGAGDEDIHVGFREGHGILEWREDIVASPEAQQRIVAALSQVLRDTAQRHSPLWTYATRTLPFHAARAGLLEQVVSDSTLLAHLAPAPLWDALAAAYPDGVPQGTVSADIWDLQRQGVLPDDQGEWVAWLHWAAVVRGDAERATGLAGSGVARPWHTLWSAWRPNGRFGAVPGECGRIDELWLRMAEEGLVLAQARDITVGKQADPEWRFVYGERDPATGIAHSHPTVRRGALVDVEWPIRGGLDDAPIVYARRGEGDGRWETDGPANAPSSTPLPRVPESVTRGVSVGRTWWLAGQGGVFAVEMTPVAEEATETEARRDRPGASDGRSPSSFAPPALPTHATPAVWPLPAVVDSVVASGRVPREWLEETFGAGSCRPLAADSLPDELSSSSARDFLTETGLPVLEGFLHLVLYGASPAPDGAPALAPVPWPAEASCPPPSTGPFYDLGLWHYSGLLLDAVTGQVLRDTTGGGEGVLAGSSLGQFFTMVRLFDEYRRTYFPSAADRSVARRSLAGWCRTVDPAATADDTWQDILEDCVDYEDSTWDYASPDGWPAA